MNQSITVIDVNGMRKRYKHKKRLERQRARKVKAQKTAIVAEKGIGSLCWVRTRTGLAPYNGKGGTIWLIEKGCIAIAEKTMRGYKLWLTKGIPYTSMAEVKRNCKSYVAYFHEIEILPKSVTFKAAA